MSHSGGALIFDFSFIFKENMTVTETEPLQHGTGLRKTNSIVLHGRDKTQLLWSFILRLWPSSHDWHKKNFELYEPLLLSGHHANAETCSSVNMGALLWYYSLPLHWKKSFISSLVFLFPTSYLLSEVYWWCKPVYTLSLHCTLWLWLSCSFFVALVSSYLCQIWSLWSQLLCCHLNTQLQNSPIWPTREGIFLRLIIFGHFSYIWLL